MNPNNSVYFPCCGVFSGVLRRRPRGPLQGRLSRAPLGRRRGGLPRFAGLTFVDESQLVDWHRHPTIKNNNLVDLKAGQPTVLPCLGQDTTRPQGATPGDTNADLEKNVKFVTGVHVIPLAPPRYKGDHRFTYVVCIYMARHPRGS